MRRMKTESKTKYNFPVKENKVADTFSFLNTITRQCINCGLCMANCRFLQKYGSPLKIAILFDSTDTFYLNLAFECSLCGLCTSVCPKNIEPSNMFLEMRRFAVRKGYGNFSHHKRLLKYERTGTSRRYSWYGLPEGCDTVYFPGCTFSGTRPENTFRVFEYLKKRLANVGIVLDCCSKISHDLGREDVFNRVFSELRDYLLQNGVKNILVNCPSCFQVFKRYGDGLNAKTVYEVFAEDRRMTAPEKVDNFFFTIHDPCVMRFENSAQSAVRKIISLSGIEISEMVHSREKTYCCGEGGGVPFVSQELSSKWRRSRKKEAGGSRVITYCAGCANFLGKDMEVDHVIDLFFDTEKVVDGKMKVSKPPFTYLNRIGLKRRFKKTLSVAVTRERPNMPVF